VGTSAGGYRVSVIEWLVLVGGTAGVAGGVRAANTRRRRRTIAMLPDRIPARQVGLDRFPPGGAFVQFSTPYSTSSRVSLNRLAAAAAHSRGQVTVIELGAGSTHVGPGMRATPTVLYVDAAGIVRRRWTAPPDRAELDDVFAGLAGRVRQAPVVAVSTAKSLA
jgi:hypothetical protein